MIRLLLALFTLVVFCSSLSTALPRPVDEDTNQPPWRRSKRQFWEWAKGKASDAWDTVKEAWENTQSAVKDGLRAHRWLLTNDRAYQRMQPLLHPF